MDFCGLAVLGLALATLSAAQPRSPRTTASTPSRAARFRVEEATIADIHSAYLRRQTTARALTQSYLDRITAYDKRGLYLNSIITVSPHALAAMAKAVALEPLAPRRAPRTGLKR